MKYLLYFLLPCLFVCCKDDKSTTGSDDRLVVITEPEPKFPPPGKVTVSGGKATFPDGNPGSVAPENSSKLKGITNDLNGDGQTDYLKVITTTEDNDGLGFKRQLVVYSGEGADLDAWYTADDVILSTEHGGMMGDPLAGVEIENGIIVVNHFGGSRQKWNYTHRFRWQNNDFQLIGTTITYGAPCDYFDELDYNLSTGKAMYVRETEDCDDEDSEIVTQLINFERKIAPPSMNGFLTGENEIAITGSEETMYY
jgi:hypothetical protein